MFLAYFRVFCLFATFFQRALTAVIKYTYSGLTFFVQFLRPFLAGIHIEVSRMFKSGATRISLRSYYIYKVSDVAQTRVNYYTIIRIDIFSIERSILGRIVHQVGSPGFFGHAGIFSRL